MSNNNNNNNSKIVPFADKDLMDGDNDLERELNAYLAKVFVCSTNLPADECLDEARKIIEIVRSNLHLV